MARRVVLGSVSFFALIASWSLFNAMTAPGTLPLSIRFVEWVRGHGGASFVAWAETTWYSHNPPPVGGRPSGGLVPHQRGNTSTGAGVQGVPHLPPPPPIPQLPGLPTYVPQEGTWSAIGTPVAGVPAMYATYLTPDATHTSLLASVAWIDPKLTTTRLFAGSQSPGTGTWAYRSPIQGNTAIGLEAVFNAGFRMNASEGGWYSEGKMAAPLVNGAASLVVFKNGTATVGQWGRDVSMGPNISSVRQNLTLIVDHGAPVSGLENANFQAWGATVGNQVMVWRSAVGVTANGALLYAAGPGLSVQSLASLMVRAGAVRAMQMDINTDWVDFDYFLTKPGQPATPAAGTKLLSDMLRPTSRYFSATARDFVGIYARPVSPPNG